MSTSSSGIVLVDCETVVAGASGIVVVVVVVDVLDEVASRSNGISSAGISLKLL